MEPLKAEEKEEHGLDVNTDYFWDKSGNIQAGGQAGMVKRLDMTPEMSRKIKAKGDQNRMKGARDKVRELIEEETEFTYDDAPISLVIAAEAAITGSSSDRKHFLAEARGIGKLSEKSQGAAPQKIIIEMDKDVREGLIRGLEIIERGQQRRIAGEAAPSRPF